MRSVADFALLAAVAAIPLLVASAPRPIAVNVRWPADMSVAERTALESQFGLTAGTRVEQMTWQYRMYDYDRARLETLVKHPRVEDTHNVDRVTFRPVSAPPQGSGIAQIAALAGSGTLVLRWVGERIVVARFWSILVLTWGGLALWPAPEPVKLLLSLGIAFATALVLSWRRAPAAVRAATGAVRSASARVRRWSALVASKVGPWVRCSVDGIDARCEQWVSGARRWIVLIVVGWALLIGPYIWIGPRDVEEFFISIVSTKLAVEAMVQGAWPFWSLDFGLGVPQPFRVQFIMHPAAPLCAIADCSLVLRGIAGAHVLLGAFCTGLLVLRFTATPLLAAAAGLSYCFASSFAQTLLQDDWPMTAIGESLRPAVLLAGLRIGSARDTKEALLWSLILGGLGGLGLGMSFTVIMLAIMSLVLLSSPGVRRNLPWFIAAGALAILIGGWHMYHLWEQVGATPGWIPRYDHPEPGWRALAWSAFLRPFGSAGESDTWRTVFFGPIFAAAAVLVALSSRERELRPLQVGLLLGVAGLLASPAWLFNINTAQWLYRAEINFFGILLGAYGVWRLTTPSSWRRWRGPIVLAQVGVVVFAIAPTWWAMVARAFDSSAPPSPPPATLARGIAETLELRGGGRVAFAPAAQDALRRRRLPLAPNQLQLEGVPAMAAVTFGIANHDLYPTEYLLETEIRMDPAALHNQASMNVFGIRLVVAAEYEPVPPHLAFVRELGSGLRLYENPGPWPEAFFVERLLTAPVPRLPGCAHRQFLCADFSRYPLERRIEPLRITRLGDGVRLAFTPSDRPRDILLTQWYVPGWEVTEGRATLVRAAEQLVGLRVGPGESAVAVRFRPRTRATLFLVSVATEVVVLLLIGWLAVTGRRERSPGASATVHTS